MCIESELEKLKKLKMIEISKFRQVSTFNINQKLFLTTLVNYLQKVAINKLIEKLNDIFQPTSHSSFLKSKKNI